MGKVMEIVFEKFLNNLVINCFDNVTIDISEDLISIKNTKLKKIFILEQNKENEY